jgi:hypothetical protein
VLLLENRRVRILSKGAQQQLLWEGSFGEERTHRGELLCERLEE